MSAKKLAQIYAWKKANPEKVKAAQARWREKNPTYQAKKKLKRYGLTQETFDALFDSQGRICAICKDFNPGPKGWQIDHDHVTGKVRGILCIHCNLALGHMKDRVDLLTEAASYLGKQS